MRSLANKTLILTGASRGIGRALALALAEAGVNLVLSATTETLLAQTAADCRERGAQADFVAGNAAEEQVGEQLVMRALDLGGFHGFIHAAGVLAPGPTVWELTGEEFGAVFDASVRAAHQLARHSYPQLMDSGGLAVFFGSGAAERVQPGIGAYCAAKAAEEHLMRQLAEETDQVTAFVYRPGIVETRMQEQARESSGGAAEELQSVFRPWKERGMLLTPEQAAHGLLSLLGGDIASLHGSVRDIRD